MEEKQKQQCPETPGEAKASCRDLGTPITIDLDCLCDPGSVHIFKILSPCPLCVCERERKIGRERGEGRGHPPTCSESWYMCTVCVWKSEDSFLKPALAFCPVETGSVFLLCCLSWPVQELSADSYVFSPHVAVGLLEFLMCVICPIWDLTQVCLAPLPSLGYDTGSVLFSVQCVLL